MNWLDILQAFGIPALFSGVVTLVVSRQFLKRDKRENNKDEMRKELEDLKKTVESDKEDQQEVNTDIELQVQELKETLNNINSLVIIFSNAMQAILRDRIIQMYNHYYKDKRYMPIYAKESLDGMYQQYHNLKGNGIIEDLVEKLYDLPTDSIDPDKGDI